MEERDKKQIVRRRIQAGNIHVCIRGNSRYVVFFDDLDRIEFLVKCNHFAKQYNTTIVAFVLMDNHIHLQVITNNLTPFIRSLLHSFSYWYNTKYGLSDKLFRTPFMSYCKFSDRWILDSILYILNNPVKAHLCEHPADHLWSSYHSIFRSPNPLERYIKVDNTFIRNYYKSRAELDKAIISNRSFNVEKDIQDHNCEPMIFASRKRVSLVDVQLHLNHILDGRDIFHLNEKMLKSVIILLRNKSCATHIQISTLTHTSCEYVRRVLRGQEQGTAPQ